MKENIPLSCIDFDLKGPVKLYLLGKYSLIIRCYMDTFFLNFFFLIIASYKNTNYVFMYLCFVFYMVYILEYSLYSILSIHDSNVPALPISRASL